MGGDHAPYEIVKGALEAQKEYGHTIVLVGDSAAVLDCLNKLGHAEIPAGIEIAHASQAVTMEDDGTAVMRTKKDSSMVVGLKMLKEGSADAFISAGNTGALLTCATLAVGRVRGIRRAAIATVVPSVKGHYVLLDSGANVECTPEFLLQFAYMGSYYAEYVLGKSNPAVGLLNNGTEDTKGTPVHKDAHALLKEAAASANINFIGNVEAREVPFGAADVIVADGFSGNVMMKTMEGTASMLTGMLKKGFKKNVLTMFAALLMKGPIGELRSMLDYKEVGGAPLLGISKPVIKAHGSSDARAIKNAVRQAAKYAETDIAALIAGNIGLMKDEK